MTKPLVTNAADETQVREADGKVKRGREKELEDFRFLLGQKQGRRALWRILNKTRVFQSSLHPSGSMVYFYEGIRNVGLDIMSDITEADPESYFLMMKENRNV